MSLIDVLSDSDTFLLHRSGVDEFLALGVKDDIRIDLPTDGFQPLREYLQRVEGTSYGHVSYRMKDAVEALSTRGTDRIGFPSVYFFRPEHEYKLVDDHWRPLSGNGAPLENDLAKKLGTPTFPIMAVPDKELYLSKVERIKEHIHRGDVYELNFCVEHVATDPDIDPFQLFVYLDKSIKAPHAAFYRLGDKYAICMSPERFLKASNGHLLTVPMKGTSPRFTDPVEDEHSAAMLRSNMKEVAENVMAVDVARNDLSRVAVSSSVKVEELCEVKRFPNVHQMVSSVNARLRDDMDHVDLLEATFPMASMTGAPKVRAMQLIEGFEDFDRGLYAGCIGRLDLRSELDLSVVIRTIQFDAGSGAVSVMTGGAITALSTPEHEYEEMMLKFRSITKGLFDAG